MTEPRDGQEPSSSPNLKADPPVAPAAAETEASIPESAEAEKDARIHVERADSEPPPAPPPAQNAAEEELDEDDEEPSAPTVKETWKLALEDATLGSAARTVAVSGVVGFAVGAWVQLGLAGRAGNDLLARNQQALADREMTIKACLGAALIGVGVALYFIWASLRKREGIAHIERWAWFLSPLMLAPGIASVLHFKPWQNEHTRLLPIVLATGMLMEVVAYKALVSAPTLARAWWRDTVEQVPRIVRERGAFWVVLAASIAYAAFFAIARSNSAGASRLRDVLR